MKPKKPHKDFPLFPHACGQWVKKVRGRLHYFGVWSDPQAALNKWREQKDDLLAGRTPQAKGDGLTLKNLVNAFLTSKKRLVASGEIKNNTFQDYYTNSARVLKVFGKQKLVASLRPTDFEKLRADFATTHGPVSLCSDITCTKTLFKYADDMFDVRVKFGQSFKKPSLAVLRRERQRRPKKLFTGEEIHSLLEIASVQLQAMIYLGINCGLGNHDCALLSVSALDLKNGWLDYPRPKTGIDRRCPLWKETIKALNVAIDGRPIPKNEEHLDRVFITRYGNTWEPKSDYDNPISKEMTKLLKALELHGRGVGFYALRHTFQTIAGQSRDSDAVRFIMGHVEDANDMSTRYNEERVSDDRLKLVTNFVRNWFLTAKPKRKRKSA